MYAKTCSCPSQKLCKHSKAVAHYFNVVDFSVFPESDGFAMVKYHNMAHGSCEPAYWYRQFNGNTDVKKLEQLIEKLKTEEEEAETVANVNHNDNEIDIIAEETENHDNDNDNGNDNDNDNDNNHETANDNDQHYDLADTSYVNEDISFHDDPDSDNIPTKLNDFFSAIDAWKEKLKQNYRGDKAIQKAVATLHQKIKKQNNGNIETFKRHLFEMGHKPSIQIGTGRKRKNGWVIPVLAHSRQRRKFLHRGNRAATVGRRFKEPNMLNRQAKKQQHSLQKDVEMNRTSARKH